MLFDIILNPSDGPLTYQFGERTSSSCTLGDGQLSMAHAKYSLGEATVDVAFRHTYEAPPNEVPAGELVELAIELSVAGLHESENASAVAGFSGYEESLSVSTCSLAECAGSPDASPSQQGTAAIPFPGPPVERSRTFQFDAFLNDSSPIGGNCRVRYVYEYVPPEAEGL